MSPPLEDAPPELPRAARDRLDRFAAAFQELDRDLFSAFAAASLDPVDRVEALVHVQELIGQGPRRGGILAALEEFREYAVLAVSRGLPGYQGALLVRSSSPSAEDRDRKSVV